LEPEAERSLEYMSIEEQSEEGHQHGDDNHSNGNISEHRGTDSIVTTVCHRFEVASRWVGIVGESPNAVGWPTARSCTVGYGSVTVYDFGPTGMWPKLTFPNPPLQAVSLDLDVVLVFDAIHGQKARHHGHRRETVNAHPTCAGRKHHFLVDIEFMTPRQGVAPSASHHLLQSPLQLIQEPVSTAILCSTEIPPIRAFTRVRRRRINVRSPPSAPMRP
jgi:hypothetical protein